MTNLTQALHVADVDVGDLENVLLNFYSRASFDGESTRYGRGEDDVALVLTYSKRTGRGKDLERGPDFVEEDAALLEKRVQDEILTEGPNQIGRNVLFSHLPMNGHYRFKDWFQLLPVPPEAPRPEYLVGDHPMLLEVSYVSSSNTSISIARRQKRLREVELLCNVFISPGVIGQSSLASFAWVLSGTGEPDRSSEFRQRGYQWPGANFGADDFSEVSSIPPLTMVDDKGYFADRGIRIGSEISLPSNFTHLLECVMALDDEQRASFLSACFWYKHSAQVRGMSRSAVILALVSAIEALIPASSGGEKCSGCGRSVGPGPTAKFEMFVDTYAPAPAATASRKRFYQLRSAITHGGKLLASDRKFWGSGREAGLEDGDMRELNDIVRIALINWLIVTGISQGATVS